VSHALRQRWIAHLIGFGVAGAVIAVTPVALADDRVDDQSETTLEVSVQTVELMTSLSGSGVGQMRFWITGPTPQDISVEILDIVSDRAGAISLLPAGSTAHSLEDIVTMTSVPTQYIPDGSTQYFSVDIHAHNPGNDIHFGGVRVSIAPQPALSGAAVVDTISAVFLPIVVAPEGFTGALPMVAESALTLAAIQVQGPSNENFFEQLLPDIPGVINRGPVTFVTDVGNPSTNPFFFSSEWTVTSGDDVLLSLVTDRRLMLPGQESIEELSTARTIDGASRPVDVLPAFGMIGVRMTGEATLGQSLMDSREASASFLVLRWKEPFAIGVSLSVVVVLLWRSGKKERPMKGA
jgi:hypothetical protein